MTTGKSFRHVAQDLGDSLIPEIKDYITKTNEANISTEGFRKAIVKSTIADKAKSIALKGVALAANMVVSALASFLISKAIEGIINWANRAKIAAEKMKAAQQAIDDAQSTLKNVSDIVSENKDRFLELAQGVDEFSNNLRLSEKDYAEYLSISNELAEIAPSLVAGYDDQGNALLSIGNNAEEASEKLNEVVEAQKAITRQTLIDNMGSVADGIRTEVETSQNSINTLTGELEMLELTHKNVSQDIANSNGLIHFNYEDFTKYGKAMSDALDSAGIDYEIVGSENIRLIGSAHKDQIAEAQRFYDAFLEQEHNFYEAQKNGIEKDIKELESSINASYSKITQNLQAWVQEDYSYQYLRGSSANLVDALVPKINWEDVEDSDTFTAEDYQNYIKNNLITPLINLPSEHKSEIESSFSKLLKFEDGDIDVVSFGQQLQNRLDELGIKIDITPIFANEKVLQDRIDTIIDDTKKKFNSERNNNTNLLNLLGLGGNVNLTNRPQISSEILRNVGWSDIEKGVATVYSSTYSNASGNIAINFTPIIADPVTGQYIGVMTPDELQSYAEGVINGTHSDYLNLQIGAQFNGQNAIHEAERVGQRISEIHATYFGNSEYDPTSFFAENSINTDAELDKWQEIYTSCNDAQEAEKKYLEWLKEIGKTEVSFSDIFALENAEGKLTPLGEANKAVDELQAAYTGLKEAMDSYNSTGHFTVDQVQDIISYGGEYLKYLMDEEGNLQLNEEALNRVAVARLNEMRIKALSSLYDELNKITDETSAQSYLETQLYETSDAYKDLTASKIEDWKASVLTSDMTEETKTAVINSFKNQAAAINEMFDNIDIGSMFGSGSSTSPSDILDKEITALEKAAEAGTITYKEYLSERERLVNDYYKSGKIKAEEYYAELEELAQARVDYYDKILAAVTRRIDREIDAIQDTIENLEKQNKQLEKQKNLYDSVLDAIQNFIDTEKEKHQDQIDNIESENDEIDKQIQKYDQLLNAVTLVFDEKKEAIQSEIDILDERIEKLQEENDEYQKAIELEKAKEALLKSQQQRTKMLNIYGTFHSNVD